MIIPRGRLIFDNLKTTSSRGRQKYNSDYVSGWLQCNCLEILNVKEEKEEEYELPGAYLPISNISSVMYRLHYTMV